MSLPKTDFKKMKKFVSIAVTVMVMAAVLCGCEKENIMDSVSRSNVDPTVVTDTIPVHDTIYHTDTLRIDSIAPGVMRIITDAHTYTGNWQVSGWNATINATHQIKTLVSENGNVFTEDSVVFTEVGTMSWTFQSTYTVSIDGPHNADGNGCPDLQATCTRTWTYNVPAEYAEYFVGNCEQVPYLTQGNGNLVTVKTTNGHETKQATFTVNVNIPTPDSTVVSRTAAWRHLNDCGQWIGTGASRTITLHCWCIESTTWSTGTVTKDSVLVAGHGTMTWNFPSYTSSQDGSYTANANGCAALAATCNVTESYDPANIQGRVYTHPASVHCVPVPTQVVVSGTTATVNTARGNVTRDAGYTITINIPTPTDTVHIFNGHIKYVARHYSAVEYYCPASGDGWYWLVITDDNQWYISPDASTVSGLSFTQYGTLTASDYAHIVSESNFTAAEKSGNRCCAALCRNSSAGTSAHIISTVKYDPNNGNPQLKYRNMSGSLIGVCSAATGTIAQQSVPEPVGDGAVKTNNNVLTVSLGGTLFD